MTKEDAIRWLSDKFRLERWNHLRQRAAPESKDLSLDEASSLLAKLRDDIVAEIKGYLQ